MSDNSRFYDHTAHLAQRRQERPQEQIMPYDTQQPVIAIEHAAQGYEGATERTSGVDRSKALVIRLLPFTAVWLVLAVAVGWLAGSGILGLLIFSGFTGATYALMDRTEYQFSRNGLERHKVNTLAGLKREEMRHQQELRRMALQSYLRQLEVKDNE